MPWWYGSVDRHLLCEYSILHNKQRNWRLRPSAWLRRLGLLFYPSCHQFSAPRNRRRRSFPDNFGQVCHLCDRWRRYRGRCNVHSRHQPYGPTERAAAADDHPQRQHLWCHKDSSREVSPHTCSIRCFEPQRSHIHSISESIHLRRLSRSGFCCQRIAAEWCYLEEYRRDIP